MCILLTDAQTVVMLVVFSVLLENSGLLKAGPRQAEFEPAPGKTYKFSDVHGVDEAKDVGGFLPPGLLPNSAHNSLRNCNRWLSS